MLFCPSAVRSVVGVPAVSDNDTLGIFQDELEAFQKLLLFDTGEGKFWCLALEFLPIL